MATMKLCYAVNIPQLDPSMGTVYRSANLRVFNGEGRDWTHGGGLILNVAFQCHHKDSDVPRHPFHGPAYVAPWFSFPNQRNVDLSAYSHWYSFEVTLPFCAVPWTAAQALDDAQRVVARIARRFKVAAGEDTITADRLQMTCLALDKMGAKRLTWLDTEHQYVEVEG